MAWTSLNLRLGFDGLARIVYEEPVGLGSAALDVLGKLTIGPAERGCGPRNHNLSGSSSLVRPAACSSNASSARSPRASPDSDKSFSQRPSDSNSSSNQVAMESWSSSGSSAILEKASSSNFDMVRPQFMHVLRAGFWSQYAYPDIQLWPAPAFVSTRTV